MKARLHIDRCVCFQSPFSELKRVADTHACRSVEELQQFVTFGANCKLCLPYVTCMLETGEVVFHEVMTTKRP